MNLSFLLETLPAWTVLPTSDPQVFRVNVGEAQSLGSRALTKEKRNGLPKGLQRDLPFVLLCIDFDWSQGWSDDLQKKLRRPAARKGPLAFWDVPPDLSLDELLAELYEGDWCLFFFPARPYPLPPLPADLFPASNPQVAALLEATGAQAAIVSDVGDVNWLVSFREDEDEE